MVLQVDHLECIRDEQVLFTDLSFCLQSGEILQVMGANGSGKSSLLQILVGVLQPQQGRVHWQRQPVQGNAEFRAQLQYIGHKTGVKAHLTVLENLQLANHLHQTPAARPWSDALNYFSLLPLQNVFCEKLSAGQRQRVALTRLLINKASIWVLDEPFTAVDHAGIENLQQLLFDHAERGGMVVFTSHQFLQIRGDRLRQIVLG